MVEVGPEELRFEAAESARLLNDSLALGLEPADVDRIDEHVQGWAAGLVLVATALQSTDRAGDVLDAFARSRMSLHSYLVEEVLDNARPELRRFLCRTAVLNRLNAAACEAVSGDRRAAAPPDEVRTMTLFVNSVDPAGDWLRHHDLFADALRAELEKREPEIVGDLHHRAAAWFGQAGMPEDAIEHALAAGDGRTRRRFWPTAGSASWSSGEWPRCAAFSTGCRPSEDGSPPSARHSTCSAR